MRTHVHRGQSLVITIIISWVLWKSPRHPVHLRHHPGFGHCQWIPHGIIVRVFRVDWSVSRQTFHLIRGAQNSDLFHGDLDASSNFSCNSGFANICQYQMDATGSDHSIARGSTPVENRSSSCCFRCLRIMKKNDGNKEQGQQSNNENNIHAP